jgi:hypothetical protein
MTQQHGPAHYDLRIDGHLDEYWSAWFDGLTLIRETTAPRPCVAPSPTRPSCTAAQTVVDGRTAGDDELSTRRLNVMRSATRSWEWGWPSRGCLLSSRTRDLSR